MKNGFIVVAGAGGFIGGHLIADLLARGYTNLRGIDIKPFEEWYQVFDGVENVQADLKDCSECRMACAEATRSTTWRPTWAAWASSKTTRLCACCPCSSTRICCRLPKKRRRTILLFQLACVYNADKQRTPNVVALKEGCLSGDGRRRLRMGKAVQRADVPAFPRRFRPGDPRGAFSQRVRPAWHLGRRPRKGAGRNLPQGDPRDGNRRQRDRNLGRRPTDPQLHVHRRLHVRASSGSCTAISWSRSIWVPTNCDDQSTRGNRGGYRGCKAQAELQSRAPKGVNGRNSDNTLIPEPRLGTIDRCATAWQKRTPGFASSIWCT